MAEAVAIAEGRLAPARCHRRTVREATVAPPPRYGSARVRRLRERLALSQPLFARTLNVSVATVRGWEQGARVPDGPSRRLLELVERHPETVLDALRSRVSDPAA
jgi:putative transcriptional regulator